MPTQPRKLVNQTVDIFIVDDHPIVVEGLQMVIGQQSTYNICGSAATLTAALNLIQALKPDVIISDISLHQESGIDLIAKAKKALPKTKILMMSMHDNSYYIEESFRAGADGYIHKSSTSSHLTQAIETVLSGKRYLHADLEAKLLNDIFMRDPLPYSPVEVDRLTPREKTIFALIGKGKSTKFIANTLNISPRTVDSHKENIKRKLNSLSMDDVLEMAIEWFKSNPK